MLYLGHQYVIKKQGLSSELSVTNIQFFAQPVNITCEANNKIGRSSTKTEITTISRGMYCIIVPNN